MTFNWSAREASVLGQVLLDANVAAILDRYSEDQSRSYRYQRPRWYDWTPAELLKAIDGYVYQASDWGSWSGSLAEAICRKIQKQLIYRIPGYEEADTWEITADSRPLSLS